MSNGKKVAGKKAAQKAIIKHSDLDQFAGRFGDGNGAPCQICGRWCPRNEADWCHKDHGGSGAGGKLEPENGLYGHGFRSGPSHCHGWADRKETRRQRMIDDPANLTNGERVEWDEEQEKSLTKFRRTGNDPHRGA